MMPCKKCSPLDARGVPSPNDKDGKPLQGLKQVGKTQRDGTRGERTYRCLDCGARWLLKFDSATHEFSDTLTPTELKTRLKALGLSGS